MKLHYVFFVLLFVCIANFAFADAVPFRMKVLLPAISVRCEGDTDFKVVKAAAKSSVLESAPNTLEYLETVPSAEDVVIRFEGEDVVMIIKKSESNPHRQRVEVRSFIKSADGKQIETVREIFERQPDGWSWPINVSFMSSHWAKCLIRWAFLEPEF